MTNSKITRRGALAGLAATAAAPALAQLPMQGVARPDFYRFTLGEFEVATVLDGVWQTKDPHTIFGVDQDQGDVAALAEANFLPADQLEIGFAPVVINTGSEVILLDTGNGAPRRPGRGLLRERLAAQGVAPEAVDIVVITHFHPDHIGGLTEDGAPAFPNARYVMPQAEFDWWKANSDVRGDDYKALLESTAFAVAEQTSFLDGEQDIASGVTLMPAHGHTPGHSLVHIESAGRRLLVAADFCNHYVLSMQRPDWHVRFDMDKPAAAATRTRVLDMIAAERIPFTSYHMPFPSVGYIEKMSGGGYRYAAASYQFNL